MRNLGSSSMKIHPQRAPWLTLSAGNPPGGTWVESYTTCPIKDAACLGAITVLGLKLTNIVLCVGWIFFLNLTFYFVVVCGFQGCVAGWFSFLVLLKKKLLLMICQNVIFPETNSSLMYPDAVAKDCVFDQGDLNECWLNSVERKWVLWN